MLLGIDASRATPSQRTGTEAYAYHLLAALLPHAVAAGHTINLYVNSPPGDNWLTLDASVRLVPLPFPRLWTHLRLGWELRARPPDVFFTPAHVIPLTYHGSAVATVHDLGYEYFPAAHPRRQRAYLRWSTRHNARRARHLLADSHATAGDLHRLYNVPPAATTVVYPGPTPGLAPVADPTAVLVRHHLPSPYFLVLGTRQPRKNLGRIVNAFARLIPELPHHLVLAGSTGWGASSLQENLDALPPERRARIHLTGFIPERDKAALLSGATALVYPSLHEGFGLPILEAQACGTAVLTAHNSSLPEVAGDAAHFVDAADTAAIAHGLRRLATESHYRHDLVQRGHTNVARFSWRDAAAQTLAVLEAAAQTPETP